MTTLTEENVIARLRSEKAEYDEQYKEQGREDALKDVKTMSYSELIEVTKESQLYKTDVWDNWLKDQVDEYEREDSAFNAEAYLEGWEEAVGEYFEEIKDQL